MDWKPIRTNLTRAAVCLVAPIMAKDTELPAPSLARLVGLLTALDAMGSPTWPHAAIIASSLGYLAFGRFLFTRDGNSSSPPRG